MPPLCDAGQQARLTLNENPPRLHPPPPLSLQSGGSTLPPPADAAPPSPPITAVRWLHPAAPCQEDGAGKSSRGV